MILDNRQVVPDIIVSRDGVPNNSILYNVNFNNNQDAGAAVPNAKCSGKDSPRHNRTRARDIAYATGNNNGSPRHVPHNGNVYGEQPAMGTNYRPLGQTNVHSSPLHQRNPLSSHDSSPLHQPRTNQRDNPTTYNYGSPSHLPPKRNYQRIASYDQIRPSENTIKGIRRQSVESVPLTGSPIRLSNSHLIHKNIEIHSSNPYLYSPKKSQSANHRFSNYEHISGSPQRSKLTSEINPTQGSPSRAKRNCGNGDYAKGVIASPLYKPFRPRSSSHPCEVNGVRRQTPLSKIPIHTSSRNRLSLDNCQINNRRTPSAANVQKNDRLRVLNRKLSMPLPGEGQSRKNEQTYFSNHNKKQYAEEHNSNLSPKRLNILTQSPAKTRFYNSRKHDWKKNQEHPSRNTNQNVKNPTVDTKRWNGESARWNWDNCNWEAIEGSDCWNIDNDKSEEENDMVNTQEYVKHRSKKSKIHQNVRCKANQPQIFTDMNEQVMRIETDHVLSSGDSGFEADVSGSSRMVLIKCKDTNYLTRIFVNEEGIHGLKVVGRVGVGGSAQDYVMNVDQSAAGVGDLNSNHSLCSDDVARSGDVINRDALSENTTSLISQGTDTEFEHEAADYQWLLDYEYRESYSRDSLVGARDNASRVSVLQTSQDQPEISYETISRNLDANLAEIDMDDFRSEDINQLLALPKLCSEFQDGGAEEDVFSSMNGCVMNRLEVDPLDGARCPSTQSSRCFHHQQQLRLHQHLLRQRQLQEEEQLRSKGQGGECNGPHEETGDCREEEGDEECEEGEEEEELEEEFSGVSGDISLYQSGPLFSPLKEPPQIPPSFSVDSLDSDSIHEDLILTCQANKDNYTIAFEGSFVQFSEDSDYHVGSDTTGSGTWSTERLEGRSPGPTMTHSDQPYTTWSRVSRRSSQSHTPDPSHSSPARAHVNSPAPVHEKNHYKAILKAPQHQQSQGEDSRSNSMPNLMRRSLMKRSIESSGHCVKVYDLQSSLRSSQLSTARSSDANNFSLVRLFIKQKSLSKEAVSLSSSFTDPSQEGACSSSDNQSGVNDSSDWPMNSQSENDMDGSASPVPPTGFTNQLNTIHSRGYRGRGNSPNIMTLNQDSSNTLTTTDTSPTNTLTEGILNNNNNISLNHIVDNVPTQIPTEIDNVVSFEDSLKEPSPCSKPPMTSPIREEPEGMDISVDSRCENKVLLDQSEKESKVCEPLRLRDNKWNAEHKVSHTMIPNKNIQTKNIGGAFVESRQKSQPAEAMKKTSKKENTMQRRRQDSGNSSSGYVSNKGSTERIRRSSDSDKLSYMKDKPKPKPRSLKQMSDQCLQTSNLKVSATVNTSGILDKKDVYVYYPNYALPDLGFLKEKKYNIDARIFLVPQHYISNPSDAKLGKESSSKRPFSCGDMEKLRRQGFSHVKDWESLNFLLPKELKEMFLDETECMETTKPSFCQPKGKKPLNAEPSVGHYKGVDSKGSTSSVSSAQPSSGYRGSSTLLNESDAEIGSSPDVRYVYQYDTGSESGGIENPPPLPKRSISLPVEDRVPPYGQDSNETPPPRPPLPRGILRKCTSLKDYRSGGGSSSKRHSAGDAKSSMREDLLKRRSLQEPVEYQTETDKNSLHPHEPNEKSPTASMRCSCVNQCTGFCGKGLKKKNLLQVNELPEVSSHEELFEEDLVKLRSQVSNFLAAKGSQVAPLIGEESKLSCDCPRKSVSFAERVCTHQQQKQQSTRSLNESHCKDHGDELRPSGSESGERDSKSSRHSLTGDDDFPPMLYDIHDKKTLVLSVRAAVEKLVVYFNSTNHQDKSKTATVQVSQSPEVAQLTLDKLCPAIYALLSDGLLPSLHSLFGKITNSVWKVVEATSQLGPSTKALNDLVMTLNNEECLSEGPIKFNAFIFGLLNLRSLDAWLSYLRTRETSLQKHYHPEGFLYLANTAMRTLYDDLLLALRPLALLPFQLDLLHEYKALHASLLKMEERLAMQVSTRESPAGDRPSLASVSPSNPLDHLLGAKETKDFRNVAAQQDRVRALMRVLTSPEGEGHVIPRERSKSPRPRSCFEDAGVDDVNPALKKRWSGVPLGSKLITAIDRLMVEEIGEGTSSGDYTDSLDNPRRKAAADYSSTCSDEGATEMRVSDISSRDGDISERSATDKDTENEKGILSRGRFTESDESEGEKFRRLQLKWEQMTVRPSKDSPKKAIPQVAGAVATASVTSKGGKVERPDKLEKGPDKSVSPGCIQRSRIPRPVSMISPQRPFKTFDPPKERHSPHQKMHKGLSSPSDGKGTPKPAPRRSLKDRVLPTDHSDHHSSSSRGGVRSKTGSRTSGGSSGIANGNRASSVPGRGMERGASLSRIVQTLHHRMATDNGHLSFNRGDILTVVVEVDEKYLLCCLNDRKGLVPRSSVVAYHQ